MGAGGSGHAPDLDRVFESAAVAEKNLTKDLIEQLDAAAQTDGQYRAEVSISREVPSGVVADALEHLRQTRPLMKIHVVSATRSSESGRQQQLIIKL